MIVGLTYCYKNCSLTHNNIARGKEKEKETEKLKKRVILILKV